MSSIGINTGLSALLSARYMLDTIGHNIANANTPGYSRQRVQLGNASPVQLGNMLIGTGVNAGSVMRTVDELLGRRIHGQRAVMGSLSVQREGLSGVEALFGDGGANGLGDLLDGFFASVSQLSTGPSDSILRTGVVQSTDALTARFRELAQGLGQSSSDSLGEIDSRVLEVNDLAQEVAGLNLKIGETESVGVGANDLRDRRDVVLQRLSELVGATTVDGPNGSVRVLVAGNTLVGSARANRMTVASDPTGKTVLQLQGATGSVPVSGGEVGGLLRLGAELAPLYHERLDQLAHNLILELNRVHSTGIPAGGSFHALVGANRLEDFDQDGRVADELLSNAGLPFDVGSGSLYVNVTDPAGEVTQRRIDISATHTTVQDFLDELNALAGLSASVDSSGQLRIDADAGFGFDFSRRIDANPDASGLFGGARATLGTAAAGPFGLAEGDTLDVSVTSGGAPVALQIAFHAADFKEISAATAEEIAAVINADAGAQANGLRARALDGQLFLQSASQGAAAGFTVDGGTALPSLGWSGFTGTSIQGQANSVDAHLSGLYTGDADERYTFRPTGDGTIGTTAGLEVEVFDRAGNHVTTLAVGDGYVPGTELELTEGLRVSFGLGEVAASRGEFLAVDAVTDSDSADVLVGLGLNALLSGTDASDIALSPEIENDPTRLAVSLTGEGGDGSLLAALLDVEHTEAQGLQGVTVGHYLGDLVGQLGFDAALADSALESSDAVLQSLEQRQSAVSGVNVDEELVDLVAYQQSFAAAAQYLSVVNQVGDELMSILQ